jgi:hypothetical protein
MWSWNFPAKGLFLLEILLIRSVFSTTTNYGNKNQYVQIKCNENKCFIKLWKCQIHLTSPDSPRREEAMANKNNVRFGYPSRWSGVDVLITIFCDFWQFSAKKIGVFFSKTNVMIKILHYLALFWVKNAIFLLNFSAKIFKWS